MDLDVAEPLGRQLELRRLQERGRHAEPEPLLERVVGAAREDHARARTGSPSAKRQLSHASATTSMAVTRRPRMMDAPASSARRPSAASKAARSITTASVVAVV